MHCHATELRSTLSTGKLPGRQGTLVFAAQQVQSWLAVHDEEAELFSARNRLLFVPYTSE